MKLKLKRSHSLRDFTLAARIELTIGERARISKYELQDAPINGFTLDKLEQGEKYTFKNFTELVEKERSLHDACRGFEHSLKIMLHMDEPEETVSFSNAQNVEAPEEVVVNKKEPRVITISERGCFWVFIEVLAIISLCTFVYSLAKGG